MSSSLKAISNFILANLTTTKMPLTLLKKRSQAENDPQDQKLIKSVLDIINSSKHQTQETAPGRQSNNDDLPGNTSKIVLHIDDDDDDREFLVEAIKKIEPSYILHEAQSGEDGIAYLNKAKLSGNLPCLIILDQNMPGMDGLDTYDEINKDDTLKTIPTVMFTTSSIFKRTQLKGKEHLPVFIKPDNDKEFIAIIKKILTHCKY